MPMASSGRAFQRAWGSERAKAISVYTSANERTSGEAFGGGGEETEELALSLSLSLLRRVRAATSMRGRPTFSLALTRALTCLRISRHFCWNGG